MKQEAKIQNQHLQRNAYLYIRQSTMKQVIENTESTKRQYALQKRAILLGWHEDSIITIDEDLGVSGSGSAVRNGFKHLITEVSLGNAGIVIGLEVSRLARNSSDWHRLLEICALTNTLIMDEDGIYDTSHFNDRLLLGLKGTMSEAELYVIRSRLRGGMLSKAKRGELRLGLPIGLVYDDENKVVFHPDQQVRTCVHRFFEVFAEVGSAFKTVQYFNHNSIGFPQRRYLHKNEHIKFGTLSHSQALNILHNPRYAGAYFYGRTQSQMRNGKKQQVTQPSEAWHSFVMNAHEGYINWDQFKKNQEILARNAQLIGKERKATPPREGPALLQGIVLCGKCGRRMGVRYQTRNGKINPSYRCISNKKDYAELDCQIIPGTNIDKFISEKLAELLDVDSLEIAYAVQNKLVYKHEQLIKSLEKQVQRTQYQTHLAQQRYMRVDPANRLVADNLEREWNEQLRKLNEEKENLEKQRNDASNNMDTMKNNELKKLVKDFSSVWNNPQIPAREKKRIIQLVVKDATILRTEKNIELHIRYKGGKSESYYLDPPKNPFIELKTDKATIDLIDKMLTQHSETDVASYLNKNGYLTGAGLTFNRQTINNIKNLYGLLSFRDRLKAIGYQTAKELAKTYGVDVNRFKKLREEGQVEFKPFHKGGYLYRVDDARQLF